MAERPAQDFHIAVDPTRLTMFGHAGGFEEISGDHRRNHARDGKAHENRSDNGQSEIFEELPRDTGHQTNGQEHRDNRKCRCDHGKPDFVGGIN